MRSSTDNKTQDLPEIKRNAKIPKLEVENVIGYTDSTSDMDSNKEISKVGLEDNGLLQGYHSSNPSTDYDHHLKNAIETDQIAESVGFSAFACATLIPTDNYRP